VDDDGDDRDKTVMTPHSRYLCVQTGARRGYAVPRLLHEAGMLAAFYTDFAGPGRALRFLQHLPGFRSLSARLARREIPAEIVHKTTAFPGSFLPAMLGDLLFRRELEFTFRRQIATSERWARAMKRRGFGQATHLYSMLNEAGPLLDEAKRRGVTTVSEVYILLSTEKILTEEQRQFPDWESGTTDLDSLRAECLPRDLYPRNVDLCLCPSEAVLEDLVANWGVPRERTALVPYGMDPRWLALETDPEPGRILFVGTADLRKGIHYLAMASEILRSSGFQGEFRIAGNVSDTVRNHPVCRHLTFLGRIPRDRIHEEFRRADLLVLPSLAEGSAEVTYEALAAGVPQIVTRAAGSVARDGIEGLVVPERDAESLAAAIERGVGNLALRDSMARESRERAREYTWERYGERLLEVLQFYK